MRVFISWSGPTSHEIASVLKPWLPKVIQKITPYVSSEDIYLGDRWLSDISKELQDCSCGILCLTKDNIEAPWLNFEAGALSKSIDKARIIPFMFGLKISDLPSNSPLNQFQATRQYSEAEVKKLVKSLNEACGIDALSDSVFEQTFDMWWPELKGQLDAIYKKSNDNNKSDELKKAQTSKNKPEDKSSEILEELLKHTRSLAKSKQRDSHERNEAFVYYENEYNEALFDLKKLASLIAENHTANDFNAFRLGGVLSASSASSAQSLLNSQRSSDLIEKIWHNINKIERSVDLMFQNQGG